jgi:disulfide bond formation protein DsbB
VDKAQMTDVFAVLTVVALVCAAWIGVTALRSALGSGPAKELRERNWLTVLGFAAAVAIVCTAGSLYMSEVEPHYPPCRWCWFQRIFMYPLAVLLTMAWIRRDRLIKWYGLALGLIGGSISTYHVLLERIPALDTGSCDPDNPCTLDWLNHKWGGWITIPSMALVGFLTILVSLAFVPARRADTGSALSAGQNREHRSDEVPADVAS